MDVTGTASEDELCQIDKQAFCSTIEATNAGFLTTCTQKKCDISESTVPGGERFLRIYNEGRVLQANKAYNVDTEYTYTVTPVSSQAAKPTISANQFSTAVDNDPNKWNTTFQAAATSVLPTTPVDTPNSVTQSGTSTNPPINRVDNIGGGLSAGAISGIVIGSVAFVGIIGIAANEAIKKRNRTQAFNASESNSSGSFDDYDEESHGGSRSAQRRRMTEHNVVLDSAAAGGGIAAAAGRASRGSSRSSRARDIDFVRSSEEDGNAISNDLKSLETKINKGNVSNSAVRDLVPGAATASACNGLISASSSYDNMTSNTELDVETVCAPPGKLGIVVDSTSGGPTIHSVRDTSPLLGIISMGDKLISIDDIDVTKMSAGGVTKLMASKAQQEERKISFQKKPISPR